MTDFVPATGVTRSQVVAAARAWLGTPFHHQACSLGLGVDCDHLVIGVARQLGLVAPTFDVPAYSRQPDGTMMPLCQAYMTQIAAQDAQPGDVMVFAPDRDPQHMGILGDYRHGGLSIIHASAKAGRVIETRLMFSRAFRFVAAFALPGVADG